MVLIADDRDGGASSSVKLTGQIQQTKSGSNVVIVADAEVSFPKTNVESDHFSGCESLDQEEDDYEEYDDFSQLPDTYSIASDDSFYPPDNLLSISDKQRGETSESPTPLSFFQACCTNNPLVVKVMIRQGVTEDQVRETDKNNRTGLIVACYQGFVDIVITLAQCPYIDVNWQDNEGNTALITASQAGHITILNYLLNYYPGLDIERRNVHGFTPLMKAAMQGRAECVRTLLLAGADFQATDPGRMLTPREWALFTGRFETAYLIHRLLVRPCPEQFSASYKPEWPRLKELVAKARVEKGCLQRLSERVRSVFTFNLPHDPEENGVMDHMVRMTTSLGSPFIATACQTVCPDSPPSVGKQRYSVQEILRKQRVEQLKNQGPEHLNKYKKLFQNSQVLLVPKKKDRRASLQPNSLYVNSATTVAVRRSSLLPLHLLRRRSVRPGFVVPKVRVSKAPPSTYEPEKVRRKSSCKDNQFLQPPKWRYKELKEERKKAEEEERKKAEAAIQKRLAAGKKV
ncbi:ankyrin repeat domain-containing protein 33B [Acipenser oxyrinchus oxyrinchus]|uniref:Ankyrin repeat domain-containing protein 33B n=1 Tax=Acipenser oxyrinchus oxyrinchus TaxID=40147 RepID=A0AAD8GGD4_ACIOX|nr:ankyrin repeat domain-containing protein 33B [Acipenser oxyrinchus oxyrinchus]